MLDLTSGRTPRRISRSLVVAISAALALVAVMATSGGASAHGIAKPFSPRSCTNVVNTGGGGCANPGPVVLTPQEQTILANKNALALEYAQMRIGKLSAAAFQADQQAFLGKYGGSATIHPAMIPYCPSIAIGPNVACGSNWVNMTQQAQSNSYYCGPATASEVLGARGINVSQSTLAGNSYLKTNANGGTDWNPYVMGPTLNALTSTSYYVAVNGSGVGGGFSQSAWQGALTYDVDNGWAIAGNIVEYSNSDPHLVGHPRSMTIYHWIGIYGYTSYGNNTSYADSVHGDSWIWSWAANVPAYSTISSSSMTTLLNQRGYVW